MNKRLRVEVDFDGEKVYGSVKIKDYLRAIRSMKKELWKWLYIPVNSYAFDKYENHICCFLPDKIRVVGVNPVVF